MLCSSMPVLQAEMMLKDNHGCREVCHAPECGLLKASTQTTQTDAEGNRVQTRVLMRRVFLAPIAVLEVAVFLGVIILWEALMQLRLVPCPHLHCHAILNYDTYTLQTKGG
jgi:hypothetical protein